jgi:hypothetical protein
MPETVEYVSGLDLGQANEFTALAILERRTHLRNRPHRGVGAAPLRFCITMGTRRGSRHDD